MLNFLQVTEPKFEELSEYSPVNCRGSHCRPGGLKEAVEQTQQREKLKKQIAQLKAKMKKEKQLGPQMD